MLSEFAVELFAAALTGISAVVGWTVKRTKEYENRLTGLEHETRVNKEDSRMDDIEGTLDRVEDNQERMLRYFEGDPADPQSKGLLDDVASLVDDESEDDQ